MNISNRFGFQLILLKDPTVYFPLVSIRLNCSDSYSNKSFSIIFLPHLPLLLTKKLYQFNLWHVLLFFYLSKKRFKHKTFFNKNLFSYMKSSCFSFSVVIVAKSTMPDLGMKSLSYMFYTYLVEFFLEISNMLLFFSNSNIWRSYDRLKI